RLTGGARPPNGRARPVRGNRGPGALALLSWPGSALDHRRYDERVAPRRLTDVAPHGVDDVVADVAQAARLANALLWRLETDLLDLVLQAVLAHHHTAHDHLDGRLLAGQRHDHHHALGRQRLPVTDDRLGHLVARLAGGVDQHHAGVDAAGDLHVVLGQ